jgi:AcrR family transcriptional regulator
MAEGVKGRTYDSARRRAQVRRTRAGIVDAAGELFLERGYLATTVDAIADRAGASPATVYRLFGAKRAILAAVLDVAFVGDDEPVALHERPPLLAAFAAFARDDPRELLIGFARICRELLDRSAPIQHVLRGAAAVDPEAAELLDLTQARRLEGQSRVARELAARGALAEGIDEAAAADTIYTLMAPEVHHLLTIERKWDADRYQTWLADALCALLLPRADGARR